MLEKSKFEGDSLKFGKISGAPCDSRENTISGCLFATFLKIKFNESPLNLIFFQHILKFLGIFAPLGTQVAAENVGHNALRSCGKYLHSPRFPTVSRPNTPRPPLTTDDVEQMACLKKQYLFDVLVSLYVTSSRSSLSCRVC